MKNIKKLSVASRWLATLAVPGLLLACGREAGPSAERKSAAAAAAAAASAINAPGSARPMPSGAVPEPSAAAAEPEPPSGLPQVNAEQLLATIRASGRKATLVNAWASWCGPCRREVPMLQALSANLKPLGAEIVLVSVDDTKDEPKARAFLRDKGITLKSYLVQGSIADFKAGIDPEWPGMLPASFLFDSGGRLVHFWGGEAFENEIVPVVEGFLAGRSIPSETRYGLAPGKVEP